MTQPKPKVSIVMVPRERHSLVRNSMEHIYAFTEIPFEFILVDCGFPKDVREKIEVWAKTQSNFRWVKPGRMVYPYEAKNLAMKELSPETQWVVFIDSDVIVSSGWLSAMIQAAEETGARAVHPLYLFDHHQDVTVHMAEGIIKKMTRHGKPTIQMVMGNVGMRLTTLHDLKRKESDFLEFHAFLARRDLLEKMGEFEPVTLAEDVNWSLKYHQLFPEEKIIYEPKSVIRYIAGPPFHKTDMPYFKFRWSREAMDRSLAFLRSHWPEVHEAYWQSKIEWALYHSSRTSFFFEPVQRIKKLRVETSQLFDRAKKKLAKIGGRSV